MTLEPGTRLGPYDVIAKLGEGGMGEVYRARDTKLGRDVALKILPETFTADEDRLARFRREAQVLASLNHSNIAAIYGFEDSGATHALVMELVEGQDLSELIGGPQRLQVNDVLPIARQIAEALEAAHEAGVIHRDLKPANIKVRADGTVKVLDFGLAKAADSGASGPDPANSPTLTARATQMGMILGTAAYMSPEQARGKSVDRRTDVWAFGAVLFEMLAGQRAFGGDDVSMTLASVLKKDLDWSLLPAATPAPLRRMIERCFEVDPRKRYQSMGDVRYELEQWTASGFDVAAPPPAGDRVVPAWWLRPLPLAGTVALLLVATAAVTWNLRPAADAQLPMTSVKMELSPNESLGTLFGANAALSPDGRTIVFVTETQGSSSLSVRRLDQLDATRLAGTEDARSPFFSPDGLWIGFQSTRGLMKIGVTGGAALEIADLGPNPGRGASWGGDTIVFSDVNTGLLQVPAAGGDPVPLTSLDVARDERTHRWPSFLPGGKAVLFMVQHTGQDYDDADIEVVTLADGKRTVLVRGGAFPRYAPGGSLLFVRDGEMFALRFDPDSLRVVEPAIPVMDGVLGWTGNEASGDGSAEFALSDQGDLLYRASGTPAIGEGTDFVWIDREGAETLAFHESMYGNRVEVSPDGRKVAIEGRGIRGAGVFIKDLGRGTLTPLTSDGAGETNPVWSPDGKRIVYTVRRPGGSLLRIQTLDGTEPERELPAPNVNGIGATAWTPDGKALVGGTFEVATLNDLMLMPLDGGTSRMLVASPKSEDFGQVSPDGRWLAYSSEEKGLRQVFLTRLDGAGPRYQVSVRGGRGARWSRDGRQLYFVETGPLPGSQPESVMVLSVDAAGAVPGFGIPRQVFRGLHSLNGARYDVHPDGRLLFIRHEEYTASNDSTHAILVTGWAADVARRMAEQK